MFLRCEEKALRFTYPSVEARRRLSALRRVLTKINARALRQILSWHLAESRNPFSAKSLAVEDRLYTLLPLN